VGRVVEGWGGEEAVGRVVVAKAQVAMVVAAWVALRVEEGRVWVARAARAARAELTVAVAEAKAARAAKAVLK
jgi:hypothetical protein